MVETVDLQETVLVPPLPVLVETVVAKAVVIRPRTVVVSQKEYQRGLSHSKAQAQADSADQSLTPLQRSFLPPQDCRAESKQDLAHGTPL